MVFDDVKLDRSGQVKPTGGWIEHHNGREGDVRLVNGRAEPELTMAAGQIERWRIVNARAPVMSALDRRAPVPHHRQRRWSARGTGHRYRGAAASVGPRRAAGGSVCPGEVIQVNALRYYRGAMAVPRTERFATIAVGAPKPSVAVLPAAMRRIEPLVRGTAEPTRTVRLGWKLSGRNGVDFTVNGELHLQDEPVRVGDLQVWDIVNGSAMDHPFHLHGFFFQVVSVNGNAPDYLSWEDTFNVPANGRVRIAWVPDDRPGDWMYHCHILEHHAGGMMAHFRVVR